MSSETFFGAARAILIILVVVSVLIIGVVLIHNSAKDDAEQRCIELGQRLGYETLVISGHCYIKIRPGLRVREDKVLDFLPVIDCR